jgi:tRNA-dihydrouridine synthase
MTAPPHQPPADTAHFLYLAPILGVTGRVFRNLFSRHFSGFDAAMAPFINPQGQAHFKQKVLADVLPEDNTGLPLIPQLLHNNAANFIAMAARLEDLGYDHINWNLGCPAPMIVRKRRGSGLLPYTDAIIAFLDEVMPHLRARLSIKTRLGLHEPTEILKLLPRLDVFPLEEITVHARLGKQLYRGTTDLDGFAACLERTRHHLVYNGDITDTAVFNDLSRRFPSVQRWMIGRGALADPFLPAAIKGDQALSRQEKTQRIMAFHDELYETYRQRLFGPSHLLGRMKQLWAYLIFSFPGQERLLKKINKVSSEEQYQGLIRELR